jgi:hypothetical protein
MLFHDVRNVAPNLWGLSARPGVDRKVTGEEIRAKIEENRQKRLAIGEAMKREAGVTGHEINRHDNSGWARLQTGLINSPEGQTIKKLWTLAHECGHVFLHGDGKPGRSLPDHVMEMEAEMYAHQALHVYGMKTAKGRTDWGRWYVGTHVLKDRAAGIPIDPRVIDYVAGTRSPFETLRDQPKHWQNGVFLNPADVPLVETLAPKPAPANTPPMPIPARPSKPAPAWPVPVMPTPVPVSPKVAPLQPNAAPSRFTSVPPVWLSLVCGLCQLLSVAGPLLWFLHLADGGELAEYSPHTWMWLVIGAFYTVTALHRIEVAAFERRAQRDTGRRG